MPNTFHSGTQGFALGATPELPLSPHRSPHSFLLHFLGVSSNDTKQRGFLCFPCIKEPLPLPGGSDGKESACGVGDVGSIPGSGRSPREGNGYPFQYSCLENSMDRGAWWARVRGVTKSWTQLSENFNTTSYKEKGLISIWFFQNSSCYCLGNLGGKEILS